MSSSGTTRTMQLQAEVNCVPPQSFYSAVVISVALACLLAVVVRAVNPAVFPFVHSQGKTVVAVTSGANINFERLRLVSELAELGSRSEVMMVTTIPERAGAFRDFADAATAGSGSKFDVTEFKYR
jgi:hypothetical protein